MSVLEKAKQSTEKVGEPEAKPLLPGSFAQADADTYAYFCAWPEENSLDQDIQNLKVFIETQRLMSGMETICLHLTLGSKGREDYALVNQYQAGRAVRDPAKQARVRALRAFMETYTAPNVTHFNNYDQEADDSMCQEQLRIIREKGEEYSTIITIDKDLDMVPGQHMHPETFEFYDVPFGYGESWVCRKTTNTKVKGRGTSFFFHQLLTGDSADDIPGLPLLATKLLNRYKPTAGTRKAQDVLNNPRATRKAKDRAQDTLANRSPSKLGAVTAARVLDGVKTEFEAYKRVLECYRAYYGTGEFTFTDWRGNDHRKTAHDMLVEQANLLWMRRTPDDRGSTFLAEILK